MLPDRRGFPRRCAVSGVRRERLGVTKATKLTKRARDRAIAQSMPPLPPPIPQLIVTHGLELRFRRDEVVVNHKAADEPNPNNTISRPQVCSAYDRMLNRSEMKKHQHLACERYAVLREIELGAKGQAGSSFGRNPNAWEKGHPSRTMYQASADLREIHKLMSRQQRSMITLFIIENMAIKDIGERLDMNGQEAKGQIFAALDRMAEHFGFDQVVRGRGNPH